MKSREQTSVLVVSTISMIVCFTAWSVFAPIATELQRIYHLTTTEKSILLATPILLGSLMRIPMGILTDRYGGRKVYALTMLLLVFPLTGSGFANSYGMMLFWALFIGMAGTTFAISITYVSKLYPPEKQGLILGIAGIGNLGSALANFLVPMIYASYGLTWVFWSLAFAVGIMSIIFWLKSKDTHRQSEPKTLKESLGVLKFKETWFLSFFYFLTFGSFVTFSIYLPTLLFDLFGSSALDAGILTAVFVVIATLIRPIGGYVSDRFGSKKLLTFVFSCVLGFGLFMAFTMKSFIFFGISCLIISIMLGIGNGAVFKMVPEVSFGNTGIVTGIVGAFGGLGGFFPPIALGFIKDITGGYFLGFALLSFCSLLCLILNHTGFNQSNIKLKTKKSA
jgi:NNP family nitrate/nitrite transporter-like MFS transporter